MGQHEPSFRALQPLPLAQGASLTLRLNCRLSAPGYASPTCGRSSPDATRPGTERQAGKRLAESLSGAEVDGPDNDGPAGTLPAGARRSVPSVCVRSDCDAG